MSEQKWQVWYCAEFDVLTLWKWVDDPVESFISEHNETGQLVHMFYVGEL